MVSYLDTENIARSQGGIEYHPLRPFLPVGAKVLFLGSFPPQRKRWCIDFFYPNWINDHWRIQGQVFFGDRNHFVCEGEKRFKLDEIVRHCEAKGIAFFDTSTAVRRLKDNASDKFLEVVEPTDIAALTSQLPQLRAIVTTGEKATETICASLGIPEVPKVNSYVAIPVFPLPSDGEVKQSSTNVNDAADERSPSPTREGRGEAVLLWRLPSSSRAYPLSFEKKVEAYRKMFDAVLR